MAQLGQGTAALTALRDTKQQQIEKLQEDIQAIDRVLRLMPGRAAVSQNVRPSTRRRPGRRRRRRGQGPTTEQTVLAILRNAGKPLDNRAILEQAQARGHRIKQDTLRKWLIQAVQRKRLMRPSEGLYTLATNPTPQRHHSPQAATRRPRSGLTEGHPRKT